MFDILSTIAPIFILIALGYVATRSGLMPRDMVPGLGRLVLYFTFPALVFSTLLRVNVTEIIVPEFLLVYGLGSFLTFTLGLFISRYWSRQQSVAGGIKALGMSLPNSAFIGYPVLMQVFHEAPAVAFSMALMIENIVIFPLAMTVVEYSSGQQQAGKSLLQIWSTVIKRVLRNPIILSIAAGLLASLVSLQLPEAVDRSLQMLSSASIAVALFYIGGTLVGSPVRANGQEMSVVVIGKLLLHPLLVILLVWLLPDFDRKLQLSAILLAAMPMMTMYPVIGSSFGYQKFCATTLLVTTVISFISISILLLLLISLAGLQI